MSFIEKIKDLYSTINKKISVKWNNLCAKYKVLAWIDDNIFWYLTSWPKDKYYTICHWFRCNWNKYHWALLKTAWKTHPWDGSFILYLEECQIDKQIHWFEHHQTMVDEQYNEIMKTLRWAKYCIHILNNEYDLFHYDGEMLSIPQKKNSETGEWEDCGEAEPMITGERTIKTEDNHEIGLYRIDMDHMQYVYDGPRVNRRNASRFISKDWIESERFKEGNLDHELYMAKCRYLYYKIRLRYTDLWWD